MSYIKFGYKKSKDGNNIPVKYGQFKWGQANRFYILNNLFEYLPLYIVRNPLCNAILKSIAMILLGWQKVTLKLKQFRVSGRTGIKFSNENWKLFIRDNSPDDMIQYSVLNTYPIHRARGTQTGLKNDIARLTYDDTSWYKFYGQENCGWWLETTFPELSTDGYTYKVNKLTYLELENMFFIEYYNKSRVTSDVIEKILLHEAIPANVNTTFLELKQCITKFGLFKFGRRKFGEPRMPKQYLIGSN